MSYRGPYRTMTETNARATTSRYEVMYVSLPSTVHLSLISYLRGHGRTVRERELHNAVPVVLEASQVGQRRRWFHRRVGVDIGGVEAPARLVRVPRAFIGAPGRLPMLCEVGVSRPTPALLVMTSHDGWCCGDDVTRKRAERAKGTTHSAL